jgi:MoaA/NifB/PqqE/SkfB family radical SAM enzyme
MEIAYDEFRLRLLDKARRDRQPLGCLFEITPTCNLRCHFCYVALDPYKGPYLTTEQMRQVLDVIQRAGVLYLTLTGGEIFSRRDFEEIYRYALSKGLLVTLFSNATLVTPRIAAMLRKYPPLSMEVSIYGADATHYESTTGIPGSFARFERGVRLLCEAGVRLVLKHTVSTLSADHVPAVQSWAAGLGLPLRVSTALENRHDGGSQPSVYRIQPRAVKQLTDVLNRDAAIGGRGGPLPECSMGGSEPELEEKLYQCGAGKVAFFVDALGHASHCVLDREPSFPILEMEWRELWAAMGAWVNQPLPADAPCSGCSLRGGCHNCPARSRNATGSPYLKDTYHCDVTHAQYGLPPVRHPDYRAVARQLGACAR